MADKQPKKPKLGRPRTFPQELSTRKQIRCSDEQWEQWGERAEQEGFGSVSAWLRKVADRALKQPVR